MNNYFVQIKGKPRTGNGWANDNASGRGEHIPEPKHMTRNIKDGVRLIKAGI